MNSQARDVVGANETGGSIATVYVSYRCSAPYVQILGVFSDLDDARKHLEAIAETELEWESDRAGAGLLEARHADAEGMRWTYVVNREVLDHPRDAEGRLLDD